MADEQVGASSGPATDRDNTPVIDPTENVKDLNAAEALRQDGLRQMESRHLRELLTLRTETAKEIRAADTRLTDERFAAVERVQALTESHRIELKDDSGKALTAALAAAEKAVSEQNKSATLSVDRAVAGMKELIINNQQVNQATTNALGDKVEDLKANVAIIVNQRLGAREQRTDLIEQKTDTRGSLGTVGMVIGSIVGILGLIFGIAVALMR